jgi:HAL2 family 3'(2'),5'-bisphosphate nucleotidase
VKRERRSELMSAMRAVRAASRVCQAVADQLIRPDTLEKRDKSPVTVADFASQAVVCAILTADLPLDRIVGEEDAAELRDAANAARCDAVVRLVAAELGRPAQGRGRAAAASPPAIDRERVLAAIDLGRAEASGGRYWTLDPIDGTKGFLRREQYAIALALIEQGRVELAVLGCPNLPAADGVGALFTALRGGATCAHRLWDESDLEGTPVHVAAIASASEARFCESVESGHSDQDESAVIARRLGITAPPYRMDSQCKYAAVARNDASIYLRLPTRADYQEKIWDHAAGALIVECAGGRVSDVDGKALDFTCGRTLQRNRGVVATCGSIHDEVIAAIRG